MITAKHLKEEKKTIRTIDGAAYVKKEKDESLIEWSIDRMTAIENEMPARARETVKVFGKYAGARQIHYSHIY